uniref:Ground-like domain-containing protein n=1 Tax=Steinernema glaseri TaxID=37863 RepID=A0A1I8A9Y4_9BILA
MPDRVVLPLVLLLPLTEAFFGSFLGGSSPGCFCPPPPQCPVVRQNPCPPAPSCNSNPQPCGFQLGGQQTGGDFYQPVQHGNAVGVSSQNIGYQQAAQPSSFPITNSIYEPPPFAPPAPQPAQNELYHPPPLPIQSRNTNSFSEYITTHQQLPLAPSSIEHETNTYRTSVAPPPVDPPDSYNEEEEQEGKSSTSDVVGLGPAPTTEAEEDTEEESDTTVETTTPTTTSPTTTTPTTTSTEEVDIYDASLPDLPPEYANSSENSSQQDDKLANDYSEMSYARKLAKHRTKAAGVKAETPTSKCSDAKLRQIMRMNMVPNASISKQLIFSAGRLVFGRNLDVVCARARFSYTVLSSAVFCEVTIRPVTCFAFLQPS